MGIRTIKRRIAITGSHRSGKTVLLVSLINLLSNHSSVTRVTELSKKWPDRFAYEEYRGNLCDGNWPKKTKEISKFSLLLETNKRKFRKEQIDLCDIPGECLADVIIAKYKTYDEWADDLLCLLKNANGTNDILDEYKEALSKTAQTDVKSQILKAYKHLLSKLHEKSVPLITPSVFALGENGDILDIENSDEYLLRPLGHRAANKTLWDRLAPKYLRPEKYEVPSGSSRYCEFAPIHKELRDKHPDITKTFRENYKMYRKEKVLPIFNALSKCQSLAILIDIPALLEGGPSRLNAHDALMDNLANFILDNRSYFWPSSLKRIAFVATKTDLVSYVEEERNKLRKLLEQLSAKGRWGYLQKNKMDFLVSAANSTLDPLENEGNSAMLMGRVIDKENNPCGKLKKYTLSCLPEYWEEAWSNDGKKYIFPRCLPPFHKVNRIPPKHDGLDLLFQYLANLDGQSKSKTEGKK